jgi:hypothetical protein
VTGRLAGYRGLADTVKLTPPTHGVDAEQSRGCQDQIIALINDLEGEGP